MHNFKKEKICLPLLRDDKTLWRYSIYATVKSA